MKNYLKKINYNFNHGLKHYKKLYKSKHWDYINSKKKKLFKISELKNFRNNKLSFGLDDQFYSKNQFLNNFKELLKYCGKKYVFRNLNKKNIGNIRNFIKYKGKIVDMHDIFFIQYLYDLEKNITLNKKKWICEIGSGYGALIGKLTSQYNSKVIAIDLPESHFLASYYLKILCPKKKIFFSYQLSKESLSKKKLMQYDIFLLYPWDSLPKVKIDLFINTRSMMEMNIEIIKKYFQIIHENINKKGYFLNINRYYKDTVGYPIELHNYPYDDKWKVILSKTSWQQNHIHFLLTQRSEKKTKNLSKELNRIKNISYSLIKKDPRLIRRLLPNFIYKNYKLLKHSFYRK